MLERDVPYDRKLLQSSVRQCESSMLREHPCKHLVCPDNNLGFTYTLTGVELPISQSGLSDCKLSILVHVNCNSAHNSLLNLYSLAHRLMTWY